MSTENMRELTEAVHAIRELRRMSDELNAELESLQDEIKAAMTAANVDEISGLDFKVTWKPVTSTRLDTAALKKLFSPEDLAGYTKTTVTRRFVIA